MTFTLGHEWSPVPTEGSSPFHRTRVPTWRPPEAPATRTCDQSVRVGPHVPFPTLWLPDSYSSYKTHSGLNCPGARSTTSPPRTPPLLLLSAGTPPSPTVQSLPVLGPSHTCNVSNDLLEGGTAKAIPQGDERFVPMSVWPRLPSTVNCPSLRSQLSTVPGVPGPRGVWVQVWRL